MNTNNINVCKKSTYEESVKYPVDKSRLINKTNI